MPATKIVMTRGNFVKEHRKLIGLLSMGQKLVDEAKEQIAEGKKYGLNLNPKKKR